MEVIADTVGGAFKHNHGAVDTRHTAAHSADERLGRALCRVTPECHLAQMSHHEVGTSHCILTLAGGKRDTTVAPGDDAGVDRTLKSPELGRSVLFPKLFGIVVEHLGIHSPYRGGGVLDVGAYQGVPVASQAALYPRHVHKYQCRAAPLPRLQHDKPQWLAGESPLLKKGEHAPLRAVQAQTGVDT